jgi:drug/metabolite transporter (DMT)-like permease
VTRQTLTGSLLAVLAFMAVGSSIAAAGELTAYPVAGGQAVRYASAGLLLLVLARGRLQRPSPRELLMLVALSATGLVLFNVLLLEAVRRADAGSVGVIVGAVPVVLVTVGPLLQRERIRPALLGAAVVVAIGAALVQAAGGRMPADALLLSLGALACEACFGLLARPLIPKFGPAGVSTWIALLAVPMLLAIGAAADGGGVLATPTRNEALALGYMAAMVTAGGFVAWYGSIARLGVERAGLFSGVLPVTALSTGALLGHADVTPQRLLGIAVVAAGITAGLFAARRRIPAQSARTPARGRQARASITRPLPAPGGPAYRIGEGQDLRPANRPARRTALLEAWRSR